VRHALALGETQPDQCPSLFFVSVLESDSSPSQAQSKHRALDEPQAAYAPRAVPDSLFGVRVARFQDVRTFATMTKVSRRDDMAATRHCD
jgi:hypothetical protein